MYNFGSAIWISNQVGAMIGGLASASTVISARTHFFVQVRIISTSQLINSISNLLQKLLKGFSGITTSVSFVPALFASYLGFKTGLPPSPIIVKSTL